MSTAHDVALVFSPHWSVTIAREVIKNFPDRARIFTTSLEEICDRLPKFHRWGEDFVAWRETYKEEDIQKVLNEFHLTALSLSDERYPPLLKQTFDPPLVLFVEGYLPPKESWCAIVGARQATAYGKSQALRFGKDLARMGVGVVSGLAYGIDEHAITGACQADGAVIAILAGGHAHSKGREIDLRKLILEKGGAIVSEHPPHVPPMDYFFPVRNRIIAGIAERTLVIEAKVKSGSLITAYKALQANRDVFAVPGPITSIVSEGCHKLIQDGAGLCTSVYNLLGIEPPANPLTTLTLPKPPSDLAPWEQELWHFLEEPRTFDSLVEYAKEKGSEVAGILNIWEIDGYLALKNGRYHLVPYEHSPHC